MGGTSKYDSFELLVSTAATLYAGLDVALASEGKDCSEEEKVNYSIKNAIALLSASKKALDSLKPQGKN